MEGVAPTAKVLASGKQMNPTLTCLLAKAASMYLTKAASPSAHTESALQTVAAPGFLAPEESSVQGPMLAV